MPRTKTCLLSVKAVFLKTLKLLSQNVSYRRETLVARVKSISQRLAGLLPRHFLPQQKMATLEKRKNGSRPPMTRADFRHLRKRWSTRRAHHDFGLRPATPQHKQRRESRRGESSQMVKNMIRPGNEKGYGSKDRVLLEAHGNEARRVSTQVASCGLRPQSRGGPSTASLRS